MWRRHSSSLASFQTGVGAANGEVPGARCWSGPGAGPDGPLACSGGSQSAGRRQRRSTARLEALVETAPTRRAWAVQIRRCGLARCVLWRVYVCVCVPPPPPAIPWGPSSCPRLPFLRDGRTAECVYQGMVGCIECKTHYFFYSSARSSDSCHPRIEPFHIVGFPPLCAGIETNFWSRSLLCKEP